MYEKSRILFYIKNISVITGIIINPMNPNSLNNIHLGLYFDTLDDGIPKMIRSIRNQGYFLISKI